MERVPRAVLALIVAALTVGLAFLPHPKPMTGYWGPLISAVVFLAYSAYIWLAYDGKRAPGVPWLEMLLLGGVCGGCIGFLLWQTFDAAAAGFGIGLVLGLFADKWTGFVKHL